jgi:hypothetical protein
VWIQKARYETLQRERDEARAETLSLKIALTQAANQSWPKGTSLDYTDGWQGALQTVWQVTKKDIRRTHQSRQSRITKRS